MFNNADNNNSNNAKQKKSVSTSTPKSSTAASSPLFLSSKLEHTNTVEQVLRYRLSEEINLEQDEDVFTFATSQISDLSSPLMVCTKIPALFLEKMSEWSKQGFMLSSRSDIEPRELQFESKMLQAILSKRANHMPLKALVSAANEKDIAQTGKHGGFKSKISPRESIVAGNIPYSHSFVAPRNADYSKDTSYQRGYNLLDNSVESKFPEYAEQITLVQEEYHKIKKEFEKAGSKIQDIKIIRKNSKSSGLICISEEVEEYKKAPASSDKKVEVVKSNQVAKTKVVHFIQRAESLHSILKNIARGLYTNACVKGNNVYFKYRDFANNFNIKITDIIPKPENKDFIVNINHSIAEINQHLAQKGVLKLNDLVAINADIYSMLGDELFNYYCPLWDGEMPVMVRSGADGYPVASDVDILQVPGAFDLPADVYKNYVSAILPAEMILDMLEDIEYLVNKDLKNAQNLSNLARIFKDNFSQAYEFYRNLAPKKLQSLGTTSAYSMVMKYYFNEVLNGKNLQGTEMWLHADETSNPGPEKLDAAFSVWKDNFFYTGTEESYLYYLLHDQELLAHAPVAINAYWLAQGSKIWSDIIRIQALQCILQKYSLENYFEYLYAHIHCPQGLNNDPMQESRKKALNIVESIKKEVEKQAKAGNNLASVIDSIYEQYKSKCATISDAAIINASNGNKNYV